MKKNVIIVGLAATSILISGCSIPFLSGDGITQFDYNEKCNIG